MSLTDVMVLQAIFGLAFVVFEFPTGYIADRVGYRASLLSGAACWMAGWVLYARATSFATVAVAEIVLGAGSACVSGADRALLWASLEATGRGRQYLAWEGRVRAASQIGEAGSAAVGGWLYALHPRLPFWMQVPVSLMALVAALGLQEAPRRRAPASHGHLGRAGAIVRLALLERPRLRAAMLLSVTLGLSSFVMVWLIQPLAQARGVSPAWLGPLWAAAHLWLAVVSLGSARVVEVLERRGALVACWLLVPLGYGGLALTGAAWGLAFYLCFMTLRGLQAPILALVMQEEAPGEDRAAVLSLAALLFRLAFVVAGPTIGYLADAIGLEGTFGILALALGALSLGALVYFLRVDYRSAAAPSP